MDRPSLELWVASFVVAMAPMSLVLAVTVGESAGGLTWVSSLGLAGLVVFNRPLPRAALAVCAYLLFAVGVGALSLLWTPTWWGGLQSLAQLTLLPLVFLVGWRLGPADLEWRRLSTVAMWSLPVAVFVFARAWESDSFRFGWLVGYSARPLVMALAVLFVIGTHRRSRRVAWTAGAWIVLVAVASGGRMGLLVAVAIILISPSIRLGWRWRIAFVLMGLVAASWVVQSEAFQERFFVGRYEGTLTDILLLRGNVNTAGRAENWPRVIEACSGSSWLGKGIGATEQVTLEATAGATIHPHNEFIRWYCDVGVVGSLAFWGFFAIFGVWGLRQWIAGGNEWGAPSLQVVVALILFSLTDNVTIYSSTFMAPALLLLGSAAAARQLERVSHS